MVHAVGYFYPDLSTVHRFARMAMNNLSLIRQIFIRHIRLVKVYS